MGCHQKSKNQQITPPHRNKLCLKSPKQAKQTCACTQKGETSALTQTLGALIDNYIANHNQQQLETELSDLKNITDYICGVHNELEAPAGPPYKFHPHQWHLGFPSHIGVVNVMADQLKDIDKEAFADFEALYQYVDQRKVKFFSATCVYDFALRYGWNHKPRIVPKDFVYIHSKPLNSARRLYNLGYISELDHCLPIGNYSTLLGAGMDAMDIENFLCIYNKEIKDLPPKK